jgi:hypothetical protein
MIKKFLKERFPFLIKLYRSLSEVTDVYNLMLYNSYLDRRMQHKNTLARFGARVFSQADEDGLTLEITKRLGIDKGSFAELGVGTGVENNTLILLAKGWKGFWIGVEELAFNSEKSKRLHFLKEWVTRDNVAELFDIGLKKIQVKDVDVLSIDFDGNDLIFCEKLLAAGKCNPKLLIVEYNSKFPPPIQFSVRYDDTHEWNRDDYQSSSIQSYVDMLKKYGYKIICCNAATGVNAFFVKEEYLKLFPEVPENIQDIYVDPFHLLHSHITWPTSIKTIEQIIED